MCCVHLLNAGLLNRLEECLRHIDCYCYFSVQFYQIDRITKYKTTHTNTFKAEEEEEKRIHENGENHDNKMKTKNANENGEEEQNISKNCV